MASDAHLDPPEALPEAGTDLRVEATRETCDPRSGPSVGVRFAAQIGW